MKIPFFIGLIAFFCIVTGCSVGNVCQEERVEITPEEWSGEIAEAEDYCNALDYFDATESVTECVKNELSWGLSKKYEKYIYQLEECPKIWAEEQRQENPKNSNLSIGTTAKILTLSPKREITLVSLGWDEEKNGVFVEMKIKNLDNSQLTLWVGDFNLKLSDGNIYSPTDYSLTIPAGEEVTEKILFNLQPDEAKKIVSVEYANRASLASWI